MERTMEAVRSHAPRARDLRCRVRARAQAHALDRLAADPALAGLRAGLGGPADRPRGRPEGPHAGRRRASPGGPARAQGARGPLGGAEGRERKGGSRRGASGRWLWRTPAGLPTPTTARTWRAAGAAVRASVQWRASYLAYDLREFRWLFREAYAWDPVRGKRWRKRRALRRYWAVRQLGNYVAFVWAVVSLVVVGAAGLVAPYVVAQDALDLVATAATDAAAQGVRVLGRLVDGLVPR